MTEEGLKLTLITAISPVIADFIDDLLDEDLFRHHVKYKFKNLSAQIKKVDEVLMDGASIEECEQQLLLQRYFRQWVKDIYEQSTIHSGHSDNSQGEEAGEKDT